MRRTEATFLIGLLFSVLYIIGLTFPLTGCASRYAAYTPTPTKTPRPPRIATSTILPFHTPTSVPSPSPAEEVAQASIGSTESFGEATRTPADTPTATETFTPIPTPKPGEPTYTPVPTPTLTPTSIPTPTAIDTFTPVPTPEPGEPTYTPTATPTVPPPATETPAETPTGSPTVVPMPEVSGGWNLLRFHEVVDDFGDLHLLGVLENVTGQSQELPDLIVTFRDEAGQEVVSDFWPLALELVPVGGRAPFHLITFVEGHATYDLAVEAELNNDPLRTDLVVDNVQVFLEGEVYVVTGNLTNPGTPLKGYAELAVALLDEAEQPIGVGSELVFAEDLGSGQTASFRIEVDEFLGTAVGYDIVAVGL